MTPSQIRAELLGQHSAIRELMRETRTTMDAALSGAVPRGDLRECVQRLWVALRSHNEREESVLRDIIKHVDAWGTARAEVMDESHIKQHAELRDALLATNGGADDAALRKSVTRVLDELEEHMAHEEEVILAEHLLRDDGVVIDYFGG